MATPATLARMQVDLVANTAPFQRDMKRAEATLGKFGKDASRFSGRMDDVSNSVVNVDQTMREQILTAGLASRSFTALERELQETSKLYELGVVKGDAYSHILTQIRDRAIELESRGIKPVGVELSAFNKVMRETGGPVAKQSVRGIGTLRSAMGSLAARAAGLNGTLGTIASSLSGFALPALTTAGIFAGLAAVGLAFKNIREESKKAAENVKEFVSEFDPFQKFLARFEVREAAQAQEAQLEAERARILARRFREIGGPSGSEVREVPLSGPDLFRLHEINQELGDIQRAKEGFEKTFATNTETTGASLTELNIKAIEATAGLDRMVGALDVAAPVLDDRAERLKRAKEALKLPGEALPDRTRMLVQRGEFPDPEFKGQGVAGLQDLNLDSVNRDIQAAARALNDVGNSFDDLKLVAIAGIGGIVEAWARGTAQMEQIALNAFTRIAQAAALERGNPLWGAVIGVAGGIIGGLFGRANRPAPVSVQDFSSKAQGQMEDANEQPVVRVVFDFPDGTREPTDEELRELGFRLARLHRKGGIPR